MGRPRIYESVEELEEQIENYFEYINGEQVEIVDETGKKVTKWVRYPEPATVTGLALYLGFSDRQSLYDYEKNEKFSCIVKRGRLRVECEYEKKLNGSTPTGAIFALKNMGWKDKTEVDNNTNLTVNWAEEKTYEADGKANEGS